MNDTILIKLVHIESKNICKIFLIETMEYTERYMDIKTGILLDLII